MSFFNVTSKFRHQLLQTEVLPEVHSSKKHEIPACVRARSPLKNSRARACVWNYAEMSNSSLSIC